MRVIVFFFSSRRRHTRYWRDWSSDVCSSDLHLYNVAARDGTVIGGVQNNTPFEPLIGTKEAKYDATKFNWLGSPSIEVGILVLWNGVPVDTLEQVRAREVTVGASGANSTPSFYARLLNETLGTKLKIVV